MAKTSIINSQLRFEKIERVTPEYIQFLMAAYRDQFNSERFCEPSMVQKIWQWEYLENPSLSPHKPYAYIVRCEEKIIAQVCILPVSVNFGSPVIKGGWFQDFIVLPPWRGKGIAAALVNHATKNTQDHMDMILAGVSEESSYGAFKRSGFESLGFINKYIKPIHFKKIISAYVPGSWLPSLLDITFTTYATLFKKDASHHLSIEPLEKIDASFDTFWNEISKQFECLVFRNQDTVHWKFQKNPLYRYQVLIAKQNGNIQGYIALKETKLRSGKLKGLSVGIISDILFFPSQKEVGDALLSAALKHFGNRLDLIRCDMLSQKIQPILSTFGFIKVKPSIRFIALPLNNKITSWMMQAKHWHLSASDSDFDLY